MHGLRSLDGENPRLLAFYTPGGHEWAVEAVRSSWNNTPNDARSNAILRTFGILMHQDMDGRGTPKTNAADAHLVPSFAQTKGVNPDLGDKFPGADVRSYLSFAESNGEIEVAGVNFVQPSASLPFSATDLHDTCAYVLSGELALRIAAESGTLPTGGFAYIPDNADWAVKSATNARLLVWSTKPKVG
jgi:quercetin dioxygenase-like cupin family protein